MNDTVCESSCALILSKKELARIPLRTANRMPDLTEDRGDGRKTHLSKTISFGVSVGCI